MEKEFEDMLAAGFQLLSEGPEQVLLCRTDEGKLYATEFLKVPDPDTEDAFLQELQGKKVTHVLALFSDCSLDLPSLRFRSHLLTACPGSEEALVLLQTGSGQMALPLYRF